MTLFPALRTQILHLPAYTSKLVERCIDIDYMHIYVYNIHTNSSNNLLVVYVIVDALLSGI